MRRFEDYLKAIYMLRGRNSCVRIKDLARILNVSPATVVEYLRKLSREGLVVYEKGCRCIDLTPKGLEVARRIYNRYRIVKEFLRNVLGVPIEIAEKDACYIEHGIHEVTLEKMKTLINN